MASEKKSVRSVSFETSLRLSAVFRHPFEAKIGPGLQPYVSYWYYIRSFLLLFGRALAQPFWIRDVNWDPPPRRPFAEFPPTAQLET